MKRSEVTQSCLFTTPWTVAYQALPSMGFSRQEYWSELPFPSQSCIVGRHFTLWATREVQKLKYNIRLMIFLSQRSANKPNTLFTLKHLSWSQLFINLLSYSSNFGFQKFCISGREWSTVDTFTQIASNKGSQMSVHTNLAHTVFKKIFWVNILKAGDNIFFMLLAGFSWKPQIWNTEPTFGHDSII